MTNDRIIIKLIKGVEYEPQINKIYITFPKGCECGCYSDMYPCKFCDSITAHFKSGNDYGAGWYSIIGTPNEFFDWYFEWMMGAQDSPSDRMVIYSILNNDYTTFTSDKRRVCAEFIHDFELYFEFYDDPKTTDLVVKLISDIYQIDENTISKFVAYVRTQQD